MSAMTARPVAFVKARLSGWGWVGMLAALAALSLLALRGLPDNRLHVYFLDVGQGDAILIRAPDGREVLVDGGPSPTALLSEMGDLLPFWDRSLDLVVLTHPDGDHLSGLISLLDRYRVMKVLDTMRSAEAPEAAEWREQLARSGISPAYAQRGMSFRIGQVVMTVLNPSPKPSEGTPSDSNNNSIVLRLDYGQTSMLLAGDAEEEAEADMLAVSLPLRAAVLKVGHHGSNRSSSASFLKKVAPRLAVIQVGAGNRFNHPNPDTLDRLAAQEVLRTDLLGRIEIVSDGKQMWVKTRR